MKKFGEKVADKFLKSSKTVQFVVSWVIIIGVLILFFWLNGKYFHLGGDGTSECSGTFEYNCGDVEDVDDRINDYNDNGNE